MDKDIFEKFVENINEGYLLVDNQQNILYSNSFTVELIGYKSDELKKIRFREIIHPNNWKEMNEAFKESKENIGATTKFKSFLIKKNNINLPIELNIKYLSWKGTYYYLIILRDISRDSSIENNKIISPKFELSDEDIGSLINKSVLQGFLDDFHKLTNIGVGIMDMNGNILAVTNWQTICIKFHRVHPEIMKNCTESDTILIKGLTPGKYSIYKCKNNMWDIATPIMLGKKRIGTLFIGQFFFKEEEIDYECFEKQAEKYGFNKKLYLKALDEVPRFNKQKIDIAIDFLTKFASLISELSYSNLRLNYLLQEKAQIEISLLKQKKKLMNALESSEFYKDLLVHDIANILHIFQMSLSLVEMEKNEELKNKRFQELTEIIKTNINKGTSLVSRVRQLIKLNEEDYSNKKVDVKEIITKAILNIKAQFKNENIKILKEFPKEDIRVRGGSLLLEAFENIMKNAIIHNENEVKKIWIRISKTHYKDYSCLKLEFVDNGKGIENNKKNLIFERRVTQDISIKGMGIGLSLVKRIIEEYGGIIKVQDRIKGKYTEGSNFILLLRQS